MAAAPAEIKLSATILLLRDGEAGLEVFMVQRHHQIDFATGALVFPGGKVEPGDEAEIFLKTYPDRIIKCKVDSILWATAQGQMPISGTLQTQTVGAGLDQRIAVRLLVEPKEKDLFLVASAVGAGAIYTEKGKIIHIIRKVFVRVSTKLDWFVWKLH